MEEIDRVLCEALKAVGDVYPTVADVERARNVRMPYAVYRVTRSGTRTKEGTRETYEAVAVVVDRTYAGCQAATRKAEAAMEGLDRRMYAVSPATTEVQYDVDDRAFVGEMEWRVKRLRMNDE